MTTLADGVRYSRLMTSHFKASCGSFGTIFAQRPLSQTSRKTSTHRKKAGRNKIYFTTYGLLLFLSVEYSFLTSGEEKNLLCCLKPLLF